MRNIFAIIRNNKLYAFLLIFILAINILAFVGNRAIETQQEEVVSEEGVTPGEEIQEEDKGRRKLFDEEETKKREEKILQLAQDSPLMYFFIGMLNLVILFVILLGVILDISLLARFFGKKQLSERLGETIRPQWGIPDVVKVTLIFLAVGYLFVMLQTIFMKVTPIMDNENFRMIISTAGMNLVGISVILYFVMKKHGQPLGASGINSRGGVMRSIRYAIGGYVALLPVLLVIMVATYFVTKLISYEPPVQPIVEIFMEEKQTAVLWVSTLFAAIFGPMAEEIFFRGFMYPAIKKSIGIFWAMLISAAIFSLLHTHIVGFLPILALGFLLAYLYEKTGSLVAPITVHIIHNVGMVMLVFLMRHIGVV